MRYEECKNLGAHDLFRAHRHLKLSTVKDLLVKNAMILSS